MKLSVGQTLWFVPSHSWNGQPCSVTVQRIGRRWAYITGGSGNDRIDIETLALDGRGYSSPGRCWRWRGAWEHEEKRRAAWRELVSRLSHHPPDHLTLDDIKKIAAQVGVTLPEE